MILAPISEFGSHVSVMLVSRYRCVIAVCYYMTILRRVKVEMAIELIIWLLDGMFDLLAPCDGSCGCSGG